jgi:hypothetical protein
MPSSNRESQRSFINTFVIDTDGEHMPVDTAFGTSINSGDVHHLEGKAKGPQSGETINESCKVPWRLRASA